MGKVTNVREHDWLAVRATFDGGVKANVTWSRGGGDKVTVEPHDSKAAEQLSLIVVEAYAKTKEAAYPFRHLGDIADEMSKVAKESRTLADYLAGLKTHLRVTGERPAATPGPAETQVTVRKSRGWVVTAAFPNGDKMELKINAASVGFSLSPYIPSKYDEVLRAVFGFKQARVMDDEALAAKAGEVARGADGVDTWLTGFRAAMAPGGPQR